MRTQQWLWIVAIALTLFLARHQRVTGPTYPLSGRADVGSASFAYKLERTHAGAGDQTVVLDTGIADVEGVLEWRPHGSTSEWTAVPMRSAGGRLVAEIPHRAPGEKVDYRVSVTAGSSRVVLPASAPAVLRFRSDVPIWVLVPHILCMFGAMLFSNRAGLEIFRREPRLKALADSTVVLLILGGFVLGMLVSGYAFGVPWGGFPLGNDATDNKTLVAFVAWVAAAIAARWSRQARLWAGFAALLMFLIYLVPHSFSTSG